MEIVGELFDIVKDVGDLYDDLQPSRRLQIGYDLTHRLDELGQEGFFVFGFREIRMLEGGFQDEPSQFPVAHIRVVRKDNPDVVDSNIFLSVEKTDNTSDDSCLKSN